MPWLATNWEISPDRKTYTFHLKSDVKFSDGTDLDAAAVKTNFDKYLDPDAPNGTVMAYIGQYYAGGEVIDRNTYALHLKQPYSPLLTVLTQGYFGIQSPTALARGKKANCSKPVGGSGPFIIERWDRNRSITFVRNPHYNSAPANAKHQGPAYVDKVIWKFLKDPVLRYGSLTSGSSDVIYNVPAINWADATTRFQTRQYVTPGRPNAITLNVDHAPFDDVRVRQAFAYSADREKAVETAFLGVVPFNSNGALSQSTPDYDPAAGAYVRDPDKANALLDQAGWTSRDSDGIRTKDGRRLTARVVYAADAIVGPEGGGDPAEHRLPGPRRRLRHRTRPGHAERVLRRKLRQGAHLRRLRRLLDEPDPGPPLHQLASAARGLTQPAQHGLLQRPDPAGG